MTSEEVRNKIAQEPDFVYFPRYEYSLAKVMARYPEGVPDKLIAQSLMITEEEVEEIYLRAVRHLQRLMKVHRG